jgi:uncharacterized membrane protein YhaH (DUF805 family)
MIKALSEATASLGRTIGRTFVFSGRARRLDMGYYWIAYTLVAAIGRHAVQPTLDWYSGVMASQAIQLIAAIPGFALFARRLHDQGRSGWWTLALPPLVAANIWEHLSVTVHAFDPAWPDLGMWKLILLPLALGAFAVAIIEGDVGPNRYGPDPRQDEREPGTA